MLSALINLCGFAYMDVGKEREQGAEAWRSLGFILDE
jgi:hypothetical protein